MDIASSGDTRDEYEFCMICGKTDFDLWKEERPETPVEPPYIKLIREIIDTPIDELGLTANSKELIKRVRAEQHKALRGYNSNIEGK
jgi:hypothetical protein